MLPHRNMLIQVNIVFCFRLILICFFLEGRCDALRDLVSFVQFKKREKHHAGVFLKVTLFHLCFSGY